jgi:probable phosphomutase (TIGR03848 family)
VTTFYLVRHGVTSHTGHRLTGWMDGVSLNDEGRAQAERAAGSLAGVSFEAIYSSPIDRTRETAEILAKPHGMKVRTSKGIGEVGYGAWTGRPLKVLARTKIWATLQRWPSSVRFPEGDTLREVQVRAVEELERLRERHPRGNVCVVSHADTIKLALAHYMGIHIDLFQRILIAPASVSVLNIGTYGPQILSLNALPAPRPARR